MAERALARQDNPIGEGASAGVLLALLLLSVTGSIVAANWADGLGILTETALGGLLVGILLAKLPVRGVLAHALTLLIGAPVAASATALLLPNVLTFREKLVILQERWLTWLSKVATGKQGGDSLLFVLQLALLMWIVAYFAAWFVYRRHQVWGAILPAGIAIVFNLFYAAPQVDLYFGLYLLCALLLLVRLNLHTLERWWRGAAIGYSSDISFDFLLYGGGFAIMLMVLAWLLPASAPGPSWFTFLSPLETPWQSVEDQFSRVFNTLRGVARPAPSAFFGSSLLMGGPVHLGTRPVMDIRTDVGRYWRAAVFDEYTGTGWINTQTDTVSLPANDPRLDTAQDLLRIDVTQTVQVFLPDQNILFGETQPIRFPDLAIQAQYLAQPAADASAGGLDTTFIRSSRPLRDGDMYTVVSSVSIADPDSLRAAPTQYSDWMIKTFLQMPPYTPQRVRTLALEITRDATNPYDRAIAIQDYLRTHIQYNESVSAPPPGRDGVDYTLFDRREGYCNYYASAMAVLAREVGIPARVASGYALGDNKDGVFHVIEANAHSWPELYFPNYGWIPFEPTASQPAIVWPTKPQVGASQTNPAPTSSRRDRRDKTSVRTRAAQARVDSFRSPTIRPASR